MNNGSKLHHHIMQHFEFNESLYSTDIDFGEMVGILSLRQVTAEFFNHKCLSQNSLTSDSTGLRVYNGSHVLIRLMSKLQLHLTVSNINRPRKIVSILEIGCGCGALSAICSRFNLLELIYGKSNAADINNYKYVITDGNIDALEIAKYNYDKYGNKNICYEFQPFLWNCDSNHRTVDQLVNILNVIQPISIENDLQTTEMVYNANEGGVCSISNSDIIVSPITYDVIIGCETFYYKVEVIPLLLDILTLLGVIPLSGWSNNQHNHMQADTNTCTARLPKPFQSRTDGIFIHTHVFRGINQEQLMIDCFNQYNWGTVEIPHHTFLTPVEIEVTCPCI